MALSRMAMVPGRLRRKETRSAKRAASPILDVQLDTPVLVDTASEPMVVAGLKLQAGKGQVLAASLGSVPLAQTPHATTAAQTLVGQHPPAEKFLAKTSVAVSSAVAHLAPCQASDQGLAACAENALSPLALASATLLKSLLAKNPQTVKARLAAVALNANTVNASLLRVVLLHVSAMVQRRAETARNALQTQRILASGTASSCLLRPTVRTV